MNLPNIVSKATAAALASPTETHAVRVVLHSVSNGGQFRLRCRSRQYLFDKCGIVGRHILEIPLSVWMEGSTTSFRENKSISEDFRTANNCPYSIQVIPWKGASVTATGPAADYLTPLRELLKAINAPEIVETAFKLIDAGRGDELRDLVEFLKNTPAATQPAKEPSTAAERMRKMREAKAAKKQLQTA